MCGRKFSSHCSYLTVSNWIPVNHKNVGYVAKAIDDVVRTVV